MEGYVKSETHKGITTIEFHHPQANSLPKALLQDLALAIRQAGDDPETLVIILRSEGEKAFCAGASFDDLVAIKNEKEGTEFFSGFAHVINAMRLCKKFIIGRVQGKCIGGGVGLVAAMDYAIATEKAEIKLTELAVGIGAFVVGPVVEKKIGVSAFGQLSIDTGHWRSADWARRKGLFAEVHESNEVMDEYIQRLALNLIQANPEAMKELKKILWAGTEHWDKLLLERAAISGRMVLSSYAKAAIEKFKSAKPYQT
jgi:methylglutaconyl-CoA hydratase